MTVTVTRKFNGNAPSELRDALREEFIKWREERCGQSAAIPGARAREYHARGRRDMLEDVLDFLDELEVTP
jgi:hypothetical protein